MKFIKYLLFLLLIAFIGMAIYIAVQPNDFEVTESTTINAPKAVVFDIVSDTTDVDWSSFWKSSETMQKTIATPNDSIHQTFTSKRIKKSELKWNFVSNDDGSTTVTRKLDADNLAFMTKAKFALFGDNEEELSEQFKADLESIDKKVAKSMATYSINVDGITEYGGGFYLYKTISSTGSNKSTTMREQYDDIRTFMNAHNISASGMPFTIYIEMNLENGNVIMSNAIPVSERVIIAEDSNVLNGFMERTKALKVTLRGNHTNLKEAWTIAQKYLKDQNIEASEISPFEVYKNDPAQLPNPAHWVTEIYIPIKESAEDL
ncbi:effector binding domain-containing protein [Gelidibacter pelagius]|uniref:Effector binding domain-containing protein n=1 Tax=Gelidibacter pelagius TaxID=2819985 RepID=A0ABS3SQU8_9FLAO|nr:effector binding domain-containing protein [Gelidibacter pelagius]MBO3097327.1 effector binding domain-containing protein [Gelidibacter pelagius]